MLWAAWAEDWELRDKVSFDGETRIIYVHPEVTALDIRADVYTSWIDWVALRDNSKFLPAMRYTGLDPIGSGVFTGDTYFLINGWKLSVDLLKVRVTGVLFSDNYDTAYYTPELVPQYPATVSAIVNTISTAGGAGALDEVVDGTFTARDILKILAAVAAGKTIIVPGLPGAATVTFRSISDTSTVVTAEMVESERTSVDIDVD